VILEKEARRLTYSSLTLLKEKRGGRRRKGCLGERKGGKKEKALFLRYSPRSGCEQEEGKTGEGGEKQDFLFTLNLFQ